MTYSCRLCAKTCTPVNSTSIFSFQRNRLILDLISIFCPIRIERADNLPQKICNTCLKLIWDANELREKSVRVDIHLRSANLEEEEDVNFPQETQNEQAQIVLIKQENPLEVSTLLEQEIPIINENSDLALMDQEENEDEEEFGSEYFMNELSSDHYYDKDGKRLRNNKPASSKYQIIRGRYKCPMCNRTFTFSNAIPSHIRKVHEKEKGNDDDTQEKRKINCPYCDLKFVSLANRNRHMRKNHLEHSRKLKRDLIVEDHSTTSEGIIEPTPSTSSSTDFQSSSEIYGRVKQEKSIH